MTTPGAAPPLVHQIWLSSLPDPIDVPANGHALQKLVGPDRYRLWTLASTRQFLVDEFDNEVVQAFDRLKPFAYKADLARYCVVFKLGGYYLDVSVSDVALPEADDRDLIGFRDLNNAFSSWKFANNYFYAKSGSIIVEDAISQVLENCANRYYGKDPHYPTGPSVIGRSVAKFAPDLNVLIGEYWWLKLRRNKYLMPGKIVVGRGKIGGQPLGGVSGIPGGNNYNDLWATRDIYN